MKPVGYGQASAKRLDAIFAALTNRLGMGDVAVVEPTKLLKEGRDETYARLAAALGVPVEKVRDPVEGELRDAAAAKRAPQAAVKVSDELPPDRAAAVRAAARDLPGVQVMNAIKYQVAGTYDIYVPLVPELESHISFDEATETILAAFAPLGAEYIAALSEGLRGRWCDRYETKGKRSGAFSSGSFGAPPYILMNYKTDVFSDVYTLAHEAGHSMHTWFAQRSQPFQDYNYPIFLAEVASTFNEELLTHHLLKQTEDKKMRAYIINRQIDDIRGTLFRQTMFAEFEKIIHSIEERGEIGRAHV